jgi:carbonic anhydrase/acetyltransferase-like protein (isoleucine patch superfamily)
MPLYALDGALSIVPEEGQFWIAPNAHVIGKLRLETDVSIWFGAVLRGDTEEIVVGARTNVQEGALLHRLLRH